MNNEQTNQLETLSFVKSFSVISLKIDKETFNTLVSFSEIFQKERKKLPYHINLLDLVKTNENANSRIIAKLLEYHENGKNRRVLKSFLNLLKQKNANFNFDLNEPEIMTEQDRIDISILDKNFAIIIENKKHDAPDQPSQLARYIDVAKFKYKYSEEKIFVIYLSRDRYKKPEEQSWISPDGNFYQDVFADRYIHLTLRNDILPWLEQELLPKCAGEKDYFLKSSINQYIDYLEGIFKSRKIYNDMNERIFEHIKKELELNPENPGKNIHKVNKKLEEIDQLSQYLKNLVSNETSNYLKKVLENLKKDFSSLETFPAALEDDLLEVGVYFYYNNKPMQLVLSMDEDEDELYFGIGVEDKKHKEIKNLVKPIIEKEGFEEDDYWFGYKLTDFERGYNDLKALIEKVIKLTIPTESFLSTTLSSLEKDFEVFQEADEDGNLMAGILFKHDNLSFPILLQKEGEQLYLGVNINKGTQDEESQEKIQQLLDPVLKHSGFEEDDFWYGYRETSKAYAYNELKSLIETIQNHLNPSQN